MNWLNVQYLSHPPFPPPCPSSCPYSCLLLCDAELPPVLCDGGPVSWDECWRVDGQTTVVHRWLQPGPGHTHRNGMLWCVKWPNGHVWNGLLWRVKWYVVMCEMVCCEVWNYLSVVMCKMVCCEVWNGVLWGVKWSVVRCEVVCCDVWNGLLWCVKLSVCCDVCVGPLAAFLFWWVYKLHCLRGSVAELQNLRKKLMFMQVCFWFILSMHAG